MLLYNVSFNNIFILKSDPAILLSAMKLIGASLLLGAVLIKLVQCTIKFWVAIAFVLYKMFIIDHVFNHLGNVVAIVGTLRRATCKIVYLGPAHESCIENKEKYFTKCITCNIPYPITYIQSSYFQITWAELLECF